MRLLVLLISTLSLGAAGALVFCSVIKVSSKMMGFHGRVVSGDWSEIDVFCCLYYTVCVSAHIYSGSVYAQVSCISNLS